MASILLLPACTNLLFAPMKPLLRTPSQVNINYSDIKIVTKDGLHLHGWFLPATQSKPAKGVVLFLHGNGENISTHLATVHWLPAEGYDVYMIDYRGYGMSEGYPDLGGSALDVEASIEYVSQHKKSKQPIILLGHSFGGSIGIYAVAVSEFKENIAALITIGAFSDYRGVTRDVLARSWLTWLFQWPLSLTIDNKLSPKQYIADISPIPVLIIHGLQDKIVPVYHADVLFGDAKEPRYLEKINSDHNHVFQRAENRDVLLKYLNKFTAASD